MLLNRSRAAGKTAPTLKIAMKSGQNGKYVSADDNDADRLVANRDHVQHWETFEIYMVDEAGNLVPITLPPPGGTAPPDTAPPDTTPPPSTTADQIPIDQITFVNGPNIREFAQTTKITQLRVAGNIYVEFDKKFGPNRWPDFVPPGWDGPLQYSMGLVVKVSGAWYSSAPIECWNHETLGFGGPIPEQVIPDGRGQIQGNWYYNSGWYPLNTAHPQPHEELGFYVVAGDARNNYCPMRERSQIVKFPLPVPGGDQTWTW